MAERAATPAKGARPRRVVSALVAGLGLWSLLGLSACHLPGASFTTIERRDVAATSTLAIALSQLRPAIKAKKYGPLFLDELDWSQATATLTNTTPSTNLTQNATASVSANAARSASLVFSGITPAPGYVLTVTLKRKNRAGTLVPIASGSVVVTVQPGPNSVNVPVQLDATNGSLKIAIPAPSLQTGLIINTLAGNGTSGASGDGGAAASALLSTVDGLTVDSDGTIYFADQDNNRVRKIAPNGVITTVAGNGPASSTGDGGPAMSATLNKPSGVALDSSQHLFVSEQGGHKVRQVDLSTGTITTLAGTGVAGFSGDGAAAASAQLNAPEGVVVDNSDDIFIADTGNARIRKVSGGSHVITNYAGNGVGGATGAGGPATSAGLDDASGIGVDRQGNIYIADYVGLRVWRVNQSDFSINIIAGTGVSGNTGDGGPATSATLAGPEGVSADFGGNVYVTDFANNNIRKIDTKGIISTFVGTGVSGTLGDGGRAVDAQVDSPEGIAFDAAGNGYVADGLNFKIRKVGVAPYLYSLSPGAAAPGATLTLKGTGFNVTPALNTVVIGGVQANVTAASVNSLSVTVPVGAPVGSVNVSVTAAGSSSNSRSFTVQ